MTSEDKPVEIILIGCGAVSQNYYLPALLELEKKNLTKLKGIYDPNQLNSLAIQKKFSDTSNPKTVEEVLKIKSDLAIIASPPKYHKEQSISAMESGKAVLCEKPMAINLAEAQEIVTASQRLNKLLAVGLVRRFFPAAKMIHHILSNHFLGEIKSFHCYEGGYFNWPVQSGTFFSKEGAGGGVLIDIGVHLLDLLICWFGQPTEVIYEDDAMGGVEANCLLKLRFEEGISGTVRLSRDWTLPNYYVFEGTYANLHWEVNAASQLCLTFSGSDYSLKGEIQKNNNIPFTESAENFEQSFISQMQNVIGSVKGKSELLVPGLVGLQSLKLIDYCYRNRKLLYMPWLSNEEHLKAKELAFHITHK